MSKEKPSNFMDHCWVIKDPGEESIRRYLLINAIPKVLELLGLKGSIVTLDAIGYQKIIA